MPQVLKRPTSVTLSKLSSRSQSADACFRGHNQPAAITGHSTFEDLWWEKGEETLTSVFFLVWAVAVSLMGSWYVANYLSAGEL